MSSNLADVRKPVATANGLSNAHYIDPDTHAEEVEAVLFASWSGLAVAAEVPENGDAKPLDFLGIPLLLLRDKTGTVRVFENICRHRGMILVSEARKIEGAIRCPYHSWCYSTDGRLVSTPHVGGPGQNTHVSIVKDDLGLNEVRSYVWRDVVFINVDGKARPFEEENADLIARWSEHELPLFHGGIDSQFTLELECNWKLAIENYCESYHLPWVHPGLNSYSKLEDHYHIEKPGQYSGQGTTVYRQITGEDGAIFPDFEGLSDKWDTGAEYIAIYPNVMLAAQREHAFAVVLNPLSQSKTVENVHLYYATSDTNPALRVQNTDQWKEVLQEDVGVVEGMQKGRNAPSFDGGRFSPVMDSPTHCFHDWIASKLETRRASIQANGSK